MDDFDVLRKLVQCEDKEQIARVVDEYNRERRLSFTNADLIRATVDDHTLAEILMHLPLCHTEKERSACERKGIKCSECLYEWLTEVPEDGK